MMPEAPPQPQPVTKPTDQEKNVSFTQQQYRTLRRDPNNEFVGANHADTLENMSYPTRHPMQVLTVRKWLRDKRLLFADGSGAISRVVAGQSEGVKDDISEFHTHLYSNDPSDNKLMTNQVDTAKRYAQLVGLLKLAGVVTDEDIVEFWKLGGGKLYPTLPTEAELEAAKVADDQLEAEETTRNNIDKAFREALSAAVIAHKNGDDLDTAWQAGLDALVKPEVV